MKPLLSIQTKAILAVILSPLLMIGCGELMNGPTAIAPAKNKDRAEPAAVATTVTETDSANTEMATLPEDVDQETYRLLRDLADAWDSTRKDTK